ncbi:MAG: GNAT family N-acetyltransferase [Planctomycetaceae bacterium]|jgi:predicted TIM-barrel fold metal-dependent hydrolase/ribosomal protein S18 acetylase RimI-like enzyme|nr:GNAT family N-acetyltransferase [Planctomycetaceae bacterium]
MQIIDSHVHLGVHSHCETDGNNLPFDLYNGESVFVKTMDAVGVERAIVFPITHREFNVVRSNEYILDAYRKHPDKLIPFCRIDENLKNNLEQGFKGAKLHLVYEDLKIKDIHTALKLLEDRNVPLLLHANFDKDNPKLKVQQVKEILSVVPNLFLILAHCGRGRPNTTQHVIENATVLKKYDRVYFETSTMEYPLTGNGEIVKQLCNILGSERILFGSDYPYQKDLEYANHIAWLKKIPLSESDLQKVACGNAYRLFNLEKEERIIIRRTNGNDIPLLFDIFFNELSKQDKKYLALSTKLKYREHWEKHIITGNSVFVTTLNGKIVGYMRCFGDRKNDNKGDLWDFVVHPDCRGKGIATQMLQYLHRKFSEMFAKTDAHNVPMKSLLTKFGYTPDNPESPRVIKWNKK